jgi:hypothetical protein
LLRDPANYAFPTKHLNELDFYLIDYDRPVGLPGALATVPPKIVDLSLPNYPVRLGETHLQIGTIVVPRKSFAALIINWYGNQTLASRLVVYLFDGIKYTHDKPPPTVAQLQECARRLTSLLGIQIRDACSDQTHWCCHALYDPARIKLKGGTSSGSMCLGLNEGWIPDLPWYTDWCLNLKVE